MTNFLIALTAYVALFLILYISVKIGCRFGIRHKLAADGNHQNDVIKVVEGTVFALFGLLIAFSFSGAYTRFEDREIKIISEINQIETAYARIDLLQPAVQADMRVLIMRYIDERIAMYQHFDNFSGFKAEMDQFKVVENEVWKKSVDVTKQPADLATRILFLQAINDMLDIANTRVMITRVHPPVQIFILLIGLGALSAFLAGYSMAKRGKYSSIYTLSFIAITSFTLYVIFDLEFPRTGMIRVSRFDNLLIEMKDSLGK